MATCCVTSCSNSSFTSSSFQTILNFVLHVVLLPSRAPFLILSIYFSSHDDKTAQLVKVVSKVSTRSGLSCSTSVSPSSSDCIWESEAAVTFNVEHSVDTVTGARFHALRISHSVCAAPTQLVVIRSYLVVNTSSSQRRLKLHSSECCDFESPPRQRQLDTSGWLYVQRLW
jgi:hypothetical protein